MLESHVDLKCHGSILSQRRKQCALDAHLSPRNREAIPIHLDPFQYSALPTCYKWEFYGQQCFP
eukprot:c1618_g1_i1 orf=74-265(+)